MNYWLMKSEPDVFSIDHLAKDKVTPWEGVRNYQARNFMSQSMKKGDLVFFYHSNAEPSAIVGLMRVASEAHADKSSFDKKSPYYDEKSTPQNSRWMCVDVEFVEKFPKALSLEELKTEPELSKMLLLKKGQRLSIQPVSPGEFSYILKLAKSKHGKIK